MVTKLSFLSLILTLSLNVFSASKMKLTNGTYNVDPDHTRVSFIIDHLVVSEVQGRFNEVKGTFTLNNDISKSSIDVTVPIASVDTGVQKRDDHLRSAEFFDAKKYPNMTFKSKKFSGSLDKFKVVGDLTIKGVTREVTLEGKYNGTVKDSWGFERVGVKADGKINRKDFNIKYNDMIEAGPAVGDEVRIHILSEGTLKK